MSEHGTDLGNGLESITTDPTGWGKIKMKYENFYFYEYIHFKEK